MWRLGFLGWRAWVWLRLLAPCALVLWLAWHSWGTSTRLGLVALLALGVIGGAWFVLRDLARRELGNPVSRGRRTR